MSPLDILVRSPVAPACVTVIAIIGPDWDSVRKVCNQLAGRCLFAKNPQDCGIQYALCDSVFYLLAVDVSMHTDVADALEKEKDNFSNASFRRMEFDSARSLLFLFLCSHITLMVNSSRTVSLRNFRTLSLLQATKLRLKKALSRLNSPPAWPGHCTPWLLFVFLTNVNDAGIKAAGSQAVNLLKSGKLRPGPEGLFRCDFNCLFEGCFLQSDGRSYENFTADSRNGNEYSMPFDSYDDTIDFSFLLNHAMFECPPSLPSRLVTTVQGLVQKIDGKALNLKQWCSAARSIMTMLNLENINPKRTPDSSLLAELLSLGSKDNSERIPEKTLGKGKKVGNSYNNKAGESIAYQNVPCESFENIDYATKLEDKFIKLRCEAAVPLALEKYRSLVPALYDSRIHKSALEESIKIFRRLAHGSLCKRYESRVIEQCSKIWQGQGAHKDRRLCDSVSLTGFPCKLLRRECMGRNGKIDPAKCRSGVLHKLVCSCGKSLIERSDPFDEATANGSSITLTCCKNLSSLDLKSKSKSARSRCVPVSEFRKGLGGAWVLHRIGGSMSYDPNKGMTAKGFVPGYNHLESWKPIDSCGQVFIGLEYVCLANGQRHIFTMPGLTKNIEQGSMEKRKNVGEWVEGEKVTGYWPDVDVQVFLSSATQRTSFNGQSCAAGELTIFQLSRVWIYIGNSNENSSAFSGQTNLLLHATICSNDGGSEKEFSHSLKPILPNGNFFCLCLPRVFPEVEKQTKLNHSAIADASKSKATESILVLKRGLLRLLEA